MAVGINFLAVYVIYYITRMEGRIDEYNMLINLPAEDDGNNAASKAE